jgi:hypothetical protein
VTGSVIAALLGGVADALARSLREACFMFDETFWALVVGFALSGAASRRSSR